MAAPQQIEQVRLPSVCTYFPARRAVNTGDRGKPTIRFHRPDGRKIKSNKIIGNDIAVDPKSIFNANFANETNFTKNY